MGKRIFRLGFKVVYLIAAASVTIYLFQTPWNQFIYKKTSILKEVTEPSSEFYPSVTICSGHRKNGSEILDILEMEKEQKELKTLNMSVLFEKYDWNFEIQDIIPGLYQEYYEKDPNCDKNTALCDNKVEKAFLWNISIPHPKNSGKCFTYNPPYMSTPGECYSLRIAIGNKSDQASLEQMDDISIFLHVPGKFIYFVEQDHMPNNYKIDNLKLKRDHENIFTLKKNSFTSLSKNDRVCEQDENYNWAACLTEMFYLRKGCQDPWNVSPNVQLPVCRNATHVLQSYGRVPSNDTWDQKFWDRPYMGERELADLERNNKKCKTPCNQIYFSADINYKSKERKIYVYRVYSNEYGNKNWVYAIKLVYKSLTQEKNTEYLVCDFPCLLSSVGGYIGLFFGVSIFNLVFVAEWMFQHLSKYKF